MLSPVHAEQLPCHGRRLEEVAQRRADLLRCGAVPKLDKVDKVGSEAAQVGVSETPAAVDKPKDATNGGDW